MMIDQTETKDFIFRLGRDYQIFSIDNINLIDKSRVIVIGDSHMRFYYMGILLKLGVHHDYIHPPPGGNHRFGNVSYHWATHVSDIILHLDEYLRTELSSHHSDKGYHYIFLISVAHHYLTPPNTTHAGIVRFMMDFPELLLKLIALQKMRNVHIVWMTAPPFPDHSFRLSDDPMKTPLIAVANQYVVEVLRGTTVTVLDVYSIILPVNGQNCRNHYLCIGGLDAQGRIIVEGSAGNIVLNEIMNIIVSLLVK